jgi:formylglycine-generating enzyme required for sulfatase activity
MVEKEFVKRIREVLDEKGRDVFLDQRKLKAILKDKTFNEYKKNTELLFNIIDIDALNYINNAKNLEECRQSIVKRLEDEYDKSPAKSAEMVDALLLVLRGKIIQPIVEPPSPPPVQPIIIPTQPTSPSAQSVPKVISDPIAGEMVFVQGGTFKMGGTPEQGDDCRDNEKPVHDVTISDFYIGKYPVTQGQWAQVMGNNQYPSYFGKDLAVAERNKLPVEQVSWNYIQQFIASLNRQTGKKYRLPTEAEWEYAARGGNKSKGYKYSGSNNIREVAWYYENAGDKILDDKSWDDGKVRSNNNCTHPVGTKLPNELGIHDMSGNVWEWVNDGYGPYSENAETNPQGPSGSGRVDRGGGWGSDAFYCRVSYRYDCYPDDRHSGIGFRLVLPSP